MRELDRLMSKVIPEPNSGCWLWTGSLDGYGYGNFWFRGTWTKSHRASYVLHRGSIPTNYDIDHLCRVPACINPDHLDAVPHAVNCERGLVNQYLRATHCIRGHLLDGISTRQRFCRICARLRDQKYRDRLKAAALGLFLSLLSFSVHAATDIWIFYGAGPHFLSSGMDEIARRAQTLSGVGAVHGPYDYTETQRAYDEIMAAPPEHQIVIAGYSCGGNASGAVAQGLHRTNRRVHLTVIQPSLWCGLSYMTTTSNVQLAQDTYGNCLQTGGLGCAQFKGAAYRTVNIYRPDLHLQADTDPNSQRDVLSAIYAIANPGRAGPYLRHLHRTTYVTRYSGQTGIWRLHER